MTSYYVPLPAAEVPQNAMLNFEPLNRGIASYKEGERDNALFAYKQQQDAIQNKRAGAASGRAQTLFDQGQEDRKHQALAATVQAIAAAPPEQQPALWGRFISSVPEAADDLKKNGIDPKDHATGIRALLGQGGIDPMQRRAQEDLHAKSQAETEALGRKDQWADMFGKILSEPNAAPPQVAPSVQPQSYTPPQPNGPMLQPISDTGQPQNAMAPPPQQNGLQLVGDQPTDEATALPEPQAASPGAVYNMPGEEVINTPMGQMTRDKARRAGMALSLGGKGEAGKMMMDAASGGAQKLGRNSTAANDKAEIAATSQLANLDTIKSQFKSEYLQIPNRFQQWSNKWYEKAGGTLPAKDKADLANYTKFRQSSWHVVNQVLKDLSGTAVTVTEAERQMLDLPNPGKGFMDGDAPTEFAAKLKGSIDFAKSAIARSRYLRTQGFTGKPWEQHEIEVADMPKIINQRGAEIEQQLKQQNPKADPQRLNIEVDKRLKKEFGI